ncbi:hypothetical protein [Cellulomonas sp. URHD0024]|uniref:hypothetical protein n=1 Tax=Cellulomonas sp. URHD0024 TaxID=1302620 RepID=UPI0004296A30|nr:hypothetical protein [Cellulomonas sp. URHD0024]
MSEARRLHDQAEATLRRGIADGLRAEELSSEVAQLVGVGTDPDRTVRAQVDHRGLLTDVALTPAAIAQGTDGVSSAVLRAYRAAVLDVQERARPLTAAFAGQPVDLDDTAFLDDLDALLRGPGVGGHA